MKMKSFQADTMQEALGLVKDEMGPDAVILKSRRATRRVGGKNQPCFEVTAALDEALYARPEPVARETARNTQVTSASPANAANPALVTSDRQTPRSGSTTRSSAPLSTPRMNMLPHDNVAERIAARRASAAAKDNSSGTYDWKGSLRRVDEEGNSKPADPRRAVADARKPAPRDARATAPSAEVPAAEDRADADLIEMLRSELKEVKDRVDMPTRELKGLKEEIKAMMASSRQNASGSRQMGAGAISPSAMSPATAWIPHPEFQGLQEALVEMEVEAALAAEAVGSAYSDYRAAGKDEVKDASEVGEREAAYLARALAERVRVTGGIRLRPGRPTTVALVGPTGVGKTTTLAKLAALAKVQQGKKVGIISADSFRMGANEQLDLFGRTAGIPVKAVFSPADVAQAQREFAHCDLILVDTAGRSHTHKEMWRELQGLLHCLAPDEVHLVLSGPTRMRELWHQYGLYRDLGAGSIIFTKLDECLSLGCLYNLARRAEAPISYLCNGQVIPDHILLARTDSIAGALAGAARAALTSARVSH